MDPTVNHHEANQQRVFFEHIDHHPLTTAIVGHDCLDNQLQEDGLHAWQEQYPKLAAATNDWIGVYFKVWVELEVGDYGHIVGVVRLYYDSLDPVPEKMDPLTLARVHKLSYIYQLKRQGDIP